MPNKRDNNLPNGKSESFLTNFEAFLSEADKLLPASEYLDTVGDFLESYAKGDYAQAYEQLASKSPLRQGLSSEEWIARRLQWKTQAHPTNLRTAFINDLEDLGDIEKNLVGKHADAQVEVGWSLQFDETPLTSRLPELPVATATLK